MADRERRARDRLGHAERAARARTNVVLPGAELAARRARRRPARARAARRAASASVSLGRRRRSSSSTRAQKRPSCTRALERMRRASSGLGRSGAGALGGARRRRPLARPSRLRDPREVVLEHRQHRRACRAPPPGGRAGRAVASRRRRQLLRLTVDARDPVRPTGEQPRREGAERRDDARLGRARSGGRDAARRRRSRPGSGSRLPGGRHLSTFVTYTSLEREPDPVEQTVEQLARLTGERRPCRSSWNPGASPTSISSASGSPEPTTTCVAPCGEPAARRSRRVGRAARSGCARRRSIAASVRLRLGARPESAFAHGLSGRSRSSRRSSRRRRRAGR